MGKAFEFAKMCIASDARLRSHHERHELCDGDDNFTTFDGVLDEQSGRTDSGVFDNETDVNEKSVMSCTEFLPQILTCDNAMGFKRRGETRKRNDENCEMSTLESNLIEFISIPRRKNVTNTRHEDESTSFGEIHDRVGHNTERKAVPKEFQARKNTEKENELYYCKLCGKSFRYSHLLRGHSDKCEEMRPKSFSCGTCDRGETYFTARNSSQSIDD